MLLLMLRFMSLLRHFAPEAKLVLFPQLYIHVDGMERQHSGHIGSFSCQSPYKSKIYNQKFNLVLIYLPPSNLPIYEYLVLLIFSFGEHRVHHH